MVAKVSDLDTQAISSYVRFSAKEIEDSTFTVTVLNEHLHCKASLWSLSFMKLLRFDVYFAIHCKVACLLRPFSVENYQ